MKNKIEKNIKNVLCRGKQTTALKRDLVQPENTIVIIYSFPKVYTTLNKQCHYWVWDGVTGIYAQKEGRKEEEREWT